MWNLTKGKTFLPETSFKRLKTLYDKEKDSKAKLRLLSAIHRKQGKSIDEISYVLSKPRRTIHGWIVRFQDRGIEAKNSIKQTGRPSEMTLAQRKNLVKDLERGPPHNRSGLWNTKEVRALLEKKYRRKYVKQHVAVACLTGFQYAKTSKTTFSTCKRGRTLAI